MTVADQAAHNAYLRHRRREMAYGRWGTRRVPVDAARAHVEALRAAGVRAAQLDRLAQINAGTAARVRRPETERITADIEQAILAVPVPEHAADVVPADTYVPITGSQRRIQALVAYGYPAARLAGELGLNPSSGTMARLTDRPSAARHGAVEGITAEHHQQIKTLFDRLQMIPGPSARAAAIGERNGWPLPWEWDEDDIDREHAQPFESRRTAGSDIADRVAERRTVVAALTAQGLTGDAIAEQLHVTARTIERDRAWLAEHPAEPGPEQPVEAFDEVMELTEEED